MLARRMYRLVKQLEKRDKENLRGDSTDTWTESAASALSKAMTRKKGVEPMALQIDIDTDVGWKLLLRREGLVVAEIYSGWAGPCTSMVNILKKVKVDTNDDRLVLATVNSDDIPDLKVFKGQSEPAWIFIGSGKPVKLVRGVNAAKIVAMIKSEFQHELLCMEGKAKRNLISISDEAERRQKAENEAILLAVVKEESPPKEENDSNLPPEGDDGEEEEVVEKPEFVEGGEKETQEKVNEMRRETDERLMKALELYTVLAIQGFLLETGAVTEIKDALKADFKIIQERYIFLQEDGVRKLFGIPYEIAETVEDDEEIDEAHDEDDVETDVEGKSLAQDETNVLTEEASADISKSEQTQEKLDGENDENNEEGNEDLENKEIEPKPPKIIMVPVPLPDVELVGDTLLLVLESLEMRKLIDQQDGEEQPISHSIVADDLLLKKVGPDDFEEAVENEPLSLHAIYGREKYAAGVWCPRNYQEKRYVMLNFFPLFVTDILMPTPKIIPKYLLAIFPALFANEIMDHPELLNNKKDVIAEGKMKITAKLVDRMLKSRGLHTQDLEAQKKALTGYDMFVVSVDERNSILSSALASLEPIHLSIDNENGKYETAKCFPHLNILIDDDYEDVFGRDLIVEKFLSRSKTRLEAILDSNNSNNSHNIEDPVGPVIADDNDNSYASQDTLP